MSSVQNSPSDTSVGHGQETLSQNKSDQSPSTDQLYSTPLPGSYTPPERVSEARKASYVAFLYRTPFAADAYELGFATGICENYALQQSDQPNRNVPVVMMDNDFRDPDIGRYLSEFNTHEPKVAVIGDAHTQEQAKEYVDVAEQLVERYPPVDLIIVPKCDCFELIPDWICLGYPAGDKCPEEQKPEQFSSIKDWRGRRVHILGGAPQVQWRAIERLTQPTLSGAPPSDIVGLDWNGFAKVAYQGEHWKQPTARDPTHYREADDLSIRETIRRSLVEMKLFWKSKGVWPSTEPVDVYGPATLSPDCPVLAGDGRHLETGESDLVNERGWVENTDPSSSDEIRLVQYRDGTTLAFANKRRQHWCEYRGGIIREYGPPVATTSILSRRSCLGIEQPEA